MKIRRPLFLNDRALDYQRMNGRAAKNGFGHIPSPTQSARNRMRRRRFTSLMKLAVEANGVIALRMMKLMVGGKSAHREVELMVSEKIHAAIEASASLIGGASNEEIVRQYRRHVARNAKRLSKLNSGRSRNRVSKRTRRPLK
jgi:hypothetical protein